MPGRRDEITKRWCFDSVQKFWDSKSLFTISSGLAPRRREPPFADWY